VQLHPCSCTCVAWDGSGEASPFLTTPIASEIEVNRVSRALAIRTPPQANRDILVMPPDGSLPAAPFVATAADERNPAFSPDGTLLAYASDETGSHEVYARPWPGPGGRIRVSTRGGTEPLWSRDGATLYYRSASHAEATQVVRSPELAAGTPRQLFRDVYTRANCRNWDLLPSGEFLMLGGDQVTSTLHVVVNWDQRMRRR
jgi:dipeptidyl aminopeptidase/acylaminoacyl peptidase